MDETIYVILKVVLDFALEVWFSILTENCRRRKLLKSIEAGSVSSMRYAITFI